MKTHTHSHNERGVALVIVLAFLVLFSALTLAFFNTGRVEMNSSNDYASSVQVRQLADTAVNLVQSQIIDGARSWEVPDDPSTAEVDPNGRRLTWISSPGLIRSYDETGAPNRTFKLFSAANMVVDPGTEYIPAAERINEIPDDWVKKPGMFVDLNQPVLRRDPAGKIVREADRNSTGTQPTYSAQYPILDPTALGLVDGLRINLSGTSPSGSNGSLSTDRYIVPEAVPGYGGIEVGAGQPLPDTYDPTGQPRSEDTTSNPAPMPVRWMYVLANGKVTVPNEVSSDGQTVSWTSAAAEADRPSRDNPIVGRVAFWTDDETCKLNINTASEGTFTDRPWSNSNQPGSPYGEAQLRDRLPVREEYQRYPGHPATVSLSPVFGGLNPAMKLPPGDNFTQSDYNRFLKPYYDMAPRVGVGGSFGGTVSTGHTGDTAGIRAMVRDENRLYSSVDELAFRSPDGPQSSARPAVDAERETQLDSANRPVLGRFDLERAKFFLTAYNRSPEVNVFGRPRISLWMLQQERDPNAGRLSNNNASDRPRTVPIRPRNAKDELLAHCSTLWGNPAAGVSAGDIFFFQRYSIYLGSAVNGRSNVSIPFGQARSPYVMPSSQSTTLDWQLPRNRQLYTYLQQQTNDRVPGWGRSLADKYTPEGRDQILTGMIDLLRSGTNCYSQNNGPVPGRSEPDVRYEYAPARRMPDAVSGETQIVPLAPPDNTPGAGTKGYGRFPTVTEAALIFHASGVDQTSPANPKPVNKMRVVFMVEPFSPTAASWTWSPLVRYVVKGLDRLTVNGTAGYFPARLENFVTSRCGYGSGGNHNTAFTGTFASFRHWNSGGRLKPGDSTPDATKIIPGNNGQLGNPELQYNFISNEIPIPVPNNGKFTFGMNGDPIVLEIHSGFSDAVDNNVPSKTLVQTIHLQFPASTAPGWPLPRDSGADKNFQNRIGQDKFNLVNAADTVRSLEVDPKGPSNGDLRVISALKNVPANYFAGWAGGPGDPGYNDTTAAIVHSIRNGNNGTVTGGRIKGDLFSTVNSSPGNPIVARGLRGAFMTGGQPGDFDNGPYDFPDGSYINKPDDYYGSMSGGDRFTPETTTPNRQITSAVAFGSLPVSTGANSVEPWRTLLFNAVPLAGRQHPGFASPRDHLFLDLFTMPIVEPYAISEPFSTAGKVNLNFELAPFTYIVRNTALHGVLKSTRITALPSGTGYKSGGSTIHRKAIDANQTLALFRKRFETPAGSGSYSGDAGPFRTASEICDMPLVPTNTNYLAFDNGSTAWWNSFRSTGDNARESAYNVIYPRVTTRSNVFTVHMRVQTLRKRPPAGSASREEREKAFAEWDENKDKVAGEYRGSTTIERYIDTAVTRKQDPRLPDFATRPEATMDEFYRFRTVSSKRFNP